MLQAARGRLLVVTAWEGPGPQVSRLAVPQRQESVSVVSGVSVGPGSSGEAGKEARRQLRRERAAQRRQNILALRTSKAAAGVQRVDSHSKVHAETDRLNFNCLEESKLQLQDRLSQHNWTL